MRHAMIVRAGVATDDARIPVTDTGSLKEIVAGPLELGAKVAVFDDQLHIRISEQQVIVDQWRSVSEVERRVTGLLEIDKGKAVQLPRNVARGEEGADEILRAVGRAGVADHPTRDVWRDRGETALEIRH